MSDKRETIASLVSYLQALVEVSKHTDVRVFSEVKRTIGQIEKIINE
ncbi:hypothetical protein AABM38_10090 [Heyndrickxia sp. MSNUG]